MPLGSFQSNKPEVRLILDAKALLGEGSIWHPLENKLYWIDIDGKLLHIYDPLTNTNQQHYSGARIGTVVHVRSGGALVALQNGIHKIDTKTGEFTFIINPLNDPAIRFNDGKCDPSGRFWVGTLALDSRKGVGVLYRFDPDGSIHLMLENITISNGIVWSADKKIMYYIDTPTQVVQGFDYDDETGQISNGRVVVRIPKEEGAPDGMAIDNEGKLWIALWGGGAVGRFDPLTGKMLDKVNVPAPNVTSCAFGGKDFKTLYITTARKSMSEEEFKNFPLSGGLFAVEPGAQGVPTHFFDADA